MKIIRKKNDVECVSLGNEMGLLNVQTGNYFIFDEISSEIWGMLEEEIIIEDLVKKLVLRYNVDSETCSIDLEDLFSTLIESDLIEVYK